VYTAISNRGEFTMRKYAIGIIVAIALIVFACSTVPITGRKQLSLIPASQMLSMSYSEYDNVLKTSKLSTNKEQIRLVKKVGGRIQKAVETYFAEKGLSDQLKDYKWEFNLVESKEVNAWCMPGGKVVVYTGILPITQNEVGLAVVLGHEISHAVAQHGAERMSQQLIAQLGGAALSVALQNKPKQTRQLWMSVYGVGSQVGVLLPYSRTHESEADHLGLIFMAMAGYDPHEALTFWQRMAASGGKKPPEFLSTHPADETRIADIRKEIPEAMQYYRKPQ
jgi:predicted Zn-dependent protease